MAFITSTSGTDHSEASAPGIFRRLLSAVMRAREAQAQYRLKSQLRDLPDHVLQDIGLRGSEIKRLRNGKPPMMLHKN
jgi:uncharacterized protein YjiS (DUF1127 family)